MALRHRIRAANPLLGQSEDISVSIPFGGITYDPQFANVTVEWNLQEYGLLADFPEDYDVFYGARDTQANDRFQFIERTKRVTVEGFHDDQFTIDFSDIIPPGDVWDIEFFVSAEQVATSGGVSDTAEDRVSIEYDPTGDFVPSLAYLDSCAVVDGEVAPGDPFTLDVTLRNENDETAEGDLVVSVGGTVVYDNLHSVSGVTGVRDMSIEVPTQTLQSAGDFPVTAEYANVTASF